jgi:hypothetical protein
MIQRIQSLYLILVAVLMGIFISSPLYTLTGAETLTITNSRYELIAVLLAGISILIALGDVLLYKNRPLQIKVGWLLALLHVAVIAIAAMVVIPLLSHTAEYSIGIGSLLPPISLILVLLSIRNIKKDEKLVRGADRLR